MKDNKKNQTNLSDKGSLGHTKVASGVLTTDDGLAGASINMAHTTESSYNYIICGAGSAGCVLANRLYEESASVLLIEAGGPDNSEAISTPMRLIELWGTSYDWGYSTVPQEHANGRSLYWPRGKVLGGSSSLNGMIYVRGNASDYDQWANEFGCTGWDYNSVLPYFKKSEDFSEGESHYHGVGGLLHVTAEFTPHPVTKAIVEAAQQAGYSYNNDTNGVTQEGVAFTDLNTKNGKRESTSVAFLRPALERPNLSLITNARVCRVEVEDGIATGVTYLQEGKKWTVTANKEVIVCGGAIESPRILMLSGIGPKEDLETLGIDIKVDLPGVGKNLHDHNLCPVIYEGAKEIPAPTDMSIQALHGHCFIKSNKDLPGPDMQPLFFHVPYYAPEQEQPTMNAYTLCAAGVRPTSRGSITLRSSDPEDDMNIESTLNNVVSGKKRHAIFRAFHMKNHL